MAPNVPREPSSPPSHPRSGLAGRRERGSLFASASPKEVRKRGAQVRKVVAPHKPGCVLFNGDLAGARRASPPPSSEGSRRQGKGKRAPTGRPGCPSSAVSCPGPGTGQREAQSVPREAGGGPVKHGQAPYLLVPCCRLRGHRLGAAGRPPGSCSPSSASPLYTKCSLLES